MIHLNTCDFLCELVNISRKSALKNVLVTSVTIFKLNQTFIQNIAALIDYRILLF